jgi:hypothetical protein
LVSADPSGSFGFRASLKLLNLVDRRGLAAIT